MTTLIIFCAKYLFVLVPLIVAGVFLRLSAAQKRTLFWRGIIVLVLAVILAKGGGHLYEEPRPFVLRHTTPLIPHEADNAFPSDHTLLTFACAFLLIPFSTPAALVCAVIAALVGMSRILSLLHSPLDIAASIVFAALANGIAWRMMPVRSAPTSETESENGEGRRFPT